MKKVILIFGFYLSLLNPVSGQVQVGDGNINDYIPFTIVNGYSYSQMIYKSSQINASGTITTLSWYYFGDSDLSHSQDLVVYMGHTTKSSFIDEYDKIPIAQLTPVYSGGITTLSAPGWVTITLNTPFVYNGTDNLVVAVDENTMGEDTGYFLATEFFDGPQSIRTSSLDSDIDPLTDSLIMFPSTALANIIFGGITQSCTTPLYLVKNSVTASTATISWQAPTTLPSNGSEYYISTESASPDLATIPSGSIASGNTITISSLLPLTTYYVWVRNNCGGGNVSAWSSLLIFNTLCQASNTPYIQGFESGLDCTSQQNLIDDGTFWSIGNAMFFGFGTSPVLRYQPPTATPANIWFFTQGINLTAGTSYTLSYKYGNSTTITTEKMKVAFGNSPADAAMVFELANHANINSGTAQTNEVVFTPSTTGVYYIGFKAYSDANQGSLYLDNISVTETSLHCSTPVTLSFDSATHTTATISLQDSVTLPSVGIEYYLSTQYYSPNFDTIPTGIVTSGNTITLSSLVPNTTYYLWVRNNCGVGNVSFWYEEYSFSTLCEPVNVNYYVDFDEMNCFSFGNGTSSGWGTIPSLVEMGFYSRALQYNSYASEASPEENEIFTQGINLTAGTQYTISYRYASSIVQNMKVISTTDIYNNSSYNVLFDHQNISNSMAQTKELVFTPSVTGVYYFGFQAYTTLEYGSILLDDIYIAETSSFCSAPIGVISSAISATSAGVTWQAPVTLPSGGSEYYLSTDSTPPTLSTSPTGAVPFGNIILLNALTPNTTYYVWVRNNCGSGAVSLWSQISSFTTFCQAVNVPYNQDFSSDECIFQQNLGGGNNWTWGYQYSGFYSQLMSYFPSDSPANVWFFVKGLNLTAGTQYTLGYKYGNDSTTTTEKMKVAYGTTDASGIITNYTTLADHPNINLGIPQTNELTFTPPTSGVYYIGFKAYSDAGQGYLFLDDISVTEKPQCETFPVPSGVTKIWNGSWSPSAPTINDYAIINSPYSGNLSCYNLELNADITLNNSQYVDVIGNITGAGKIKMSSEASIKQHINGATAPTIELTKKTRAAMRRFDYIYWGTPIAGDFLSQLSNAQASTASSSGAFDSMYKYVSGSGGGWQPLTAIETGKGFITRVAEQEPFLDATTTDFINLTFTGRANTGDVTVPVTNNPSFPNGGTSHVLLANPYPSAIDANLFLQENPAIDGVVYVWTSATSNSGSEDYNQADYIAYTLAGAVVPSGIATTFNGKIASGQGFKVKALGTGNVTFTNCMRLLDNNNQFYKQNATDSQFSVDRFKLNMTGDNGVFSQILVAYMPEASYGYDRMYDAGRNSVSTAQLYSIFEQDGRKLSINARPNFIVTDVVPLGISKNNSNLETFTIELADVEGIFSGNSDISIYLHDKEQNVFHNLNLAPYRFTTNTNLQNSRFNLIYQKNDISVFNGSNHISFIKNNVFTASATELINTISIYDLTGRLIQTHQVEGREISKPFHHSKGVYIAQFTMKDGIVYSQKLINN